VGEADGGAVASASAQGSSCFGRGGRMDLEVPKLFRLILPIIL